MSTVDDFPFLRCASIENGIHKTWARTQLCRLLIASIHLLNLHGQPVDFKHFSWGWCQEARGNMGRVLLSCSPPPGGNGELLAWGTEAVCRGIAAYGPALINHKWGRHKHCFIKRYAALHFIRHSACIQPERWIHWLFYPNMSVCYRWEMCRVTVRAL